VAVTIVPAVAGISLNVEALVRIRTLLLPALVAVLLTVSATAAQAGSFVLSLKDVTSGQSFVLNDNDLILDAYGDPLGDLNSASDAIIFSGTVGVFDVQVFGNVFLPGPSGSPVQMNLTNFLVSSSKGGTFEATLTRTGVSAALFGPSVYGIAEYGATFLDRPNGGGLVSFKNTVNGTTVLDSSTDVDLDPGPPAPTATVGPIALSGDFTLMSMLTFDVTADSSVQANSALRVETVPEPTTLLLFGPGMLGLAALRRRLRSKAL